MGLCSVRRCANRPMACVDCTAVLACSELVTTEGEPVKGGKVDGGAD